ncbi:jg18577, partial [Pararge aegeria aegeria]
VTMPRLGRDGLGEKRQLEWEAAIESVIRDITSPISPQPKPPIVQIVIYESSV